MSGQHSVPPLRIAALGDFEGMHTRRWVEAFVERGHEVHAISYYTPRADLRGATLHALSGATAPSESGKSPVRGGLGDVIPRDLIRLIHAWRYTRAGLKRVLDAIQPDVFHAHYAVEHGFYGSFADFHPYVVSAWGSDLLVDSRGLLGRRIVRRTLGKADLVTANDVSLARRARELGVAEERVDVIHLGIDRAFLAAGERSVNLRRGEAPVTMISARALEPLYNLDVIIRGFSGVVARIPAARLIVAGEGSQRGRLEELARELGVEGPVTFTGRLSQGELAEALAGAQVYVSAPSSDSLALSTVEAMAAGCFPVVSDLPSNEGWIEGGRNGLVVAPRDVDALAAAMYRALNDADLRRMAAVTNRAKAEAEGLRERTMQLMERHYYRLAGHPQAGSGEAI